MARLCGHALERALLADAESRARERAEEAARYATSLYSLGMRLASSLTPTDVATTVMREAIAEHGASAGAVGLIDHERREVELLIDDDYPERALELLRRFGLDAPIPAAAAARTSKPVFVGTLEERTRRFPDLPKALGDGSVAIAALPLIASGNTFGVLVLRYTTERAFGPDERRFLLTLADDCSQALERARLHADSERRAERARLQLAIASSLDAVSSHRDRVAALLSGLVPGQADFASLETFEDDEPAPLATRQSEDRAGEEAAALRSAASDLLLRVRRSGLPEAIDVRAADDLHGSCVAVPLTVGSRPADVLLAVIAAGHQREQRRPDLALLSEIGRGAALALENARLYEREHHIAHTLQHGLLPAALPHAPGLDLAVAYAAMGEGNEVGGDFYDVFRKHDGHAAVIGDVCGKGPEAARLTALCRHTLRAAALFEGSGPGRTLALLNRAILDQAPGGQFCSVAAVDLAAAGRDVLRATLASAGHPAALVARAGGQVDAVEARGTVLGVTEAPRLDETLIELRRGDALVFVTDGVEEARNESGGFFGQERLHASVRRAARAGGDAAAIVAAVSADLDAFRGARELRDDVVILVIRFAGL